MKIGLIGFGKAGKAVANVILQNTEFSLEWVLKNSPMPSIFSAAEFLGVNSEDQGLIYSLKILQLSNCWICIRWMLL